MTGNVSSSTPLFHLIIDNIQHYTSQSPTLPAGDTMRAHIKDVYTYHLLLKRMQVTCITWGEAHNTSNDG